MAEKQPPKERGGGPKTGTGKANSSRNSITNGCQARKTRILPDERQEDYDRIDQGWKAEYEPEGYMEERLVEILIENDWFLRRTMRRLDEAEANDGNVELMLRYKTTAERAFYRSLNAVQQLRKDRIRMDKVKRDIERDLEKEVQKLKAELERRPPAPNEEGNAADSAEALPSNMTPDSAMSNVVANKRGP